MQTNAQNKIKGGPISPRDTFSNCEDGDHEAEAETIAEKKLKTMKKVCEVILLSVGSCEGYQVGDSGVTV